MLDKKILWSVLGGVALSAVARSKMFRKATVNGIAKGMQLKDEAQYTYNCLRDEAEDIYYEAKEKARMESETTEMMVEEAAQESAQD